MFRNRLLAFLLLFFPIIINAQAYEGKVEYDKKKQDAIIIEYPFQPEAVENAILAKMEKLGYRGKEEKGLFNNDKGFRTYRNAYITEISDTRHDYIIKVERKSRRDSDRSLIYMIMMKGDENAITSLDADGISRAKSFLNNLLPEVEASQLELDIKSQEEVVGKSEKKLKGLESDKKSMEDRIKKLENDIKENERDQERTKEEILNQKKTLESLKSRRKGQV